MADYYEQLQQAIDRLDELHDQALLEQMQRIVEMAKASDDNNTVAEFAQHLIQAGSHFGRLDYEMIGFGEIQSLYERDPDYADLKPKVLWYYKWLAERLPEYAEVPVEKIRAFLDQMQTFYKSVGEGLRPVYELRCRAACFMGDEAEAHRTFELWRNTEAHSSDDCPACETHSHVQYLLHFGKIEEAIEVAGPILNGDQVCSEVPATTFSRLLIPFLFTREPQEAFALSMIVRRQVRHTPGLLSHLSDHVNLLSLLGVWPIARRTLYVMLNRVLNSTNTFAQFCVMRSAWLCLARMHKSGIETIGFPPRTELSEQSMKTSAAADYFRNKAVELARAFDRRNGTDDFARRIDAVKKLASL